MSELPQGIAPPTPQPQGPVANPAYAQWEQQQRAWLDEKKRRWDEFKQACDLLKSDAATRYKIDIEADSTVAADEQAEKQARTEFLTAITPFMEAVMPQMQQSPILAPLGKELMMFAVRGFKVSRQLEDAFETALDGIVRSAGQGGQQPSQPHGNTKSPLEIQAEAETEKTKAQVQMAGVQQDAQEAGLKAQTANQANTLKFMGLQQQEKIAADKLAQDQLQHEQSLQEQQREREGREQLDAARLTRIAAKSSEGLV